MSERKGLTFIMKSASGHMVCVPQDKLESWEKAQQDAATNSIVINSHYIELCLQRGSISASGLQGYYGIGYPTASKIIIQFEKEGFITKADPKTGSRKFLNPDIGKMVTILKENIVK